jgi:hypothetical protein
MLYFIMTSSFGKCHYTQFLILGIVLYCIVLYCIIVVGDLFLIYTISAYMHAEF